MQNFCFGPKCTISRYQSCEVSILVQWTQNDVWEWFVAFRSPSTRKRSKTCVRARMHYFGVPKLWSIHSSPLHPKWCLKCFRAFHKPSARKRWKTRFRARMQYFEVPNLWSIHYSPLDPKMMFRSVLEHFANLRHVKDAKLVFRAWMHYLGY
jgi:hypothetical protein